MIVPSRVRRRFAAVHPFLDRVAAIVRETVLGYCEDRGFAYIGRVKTLESLAEKIETGRFERWSELDDLFGCSVIIPTLADEGIVLEFLENVFVPVGLKKRGSTTKAPEVFRFEATRFTGRLKPTGFIPNAERLQPNDLDLFGITFEVQIRSAFEHAWSVTTHAIYKSGTVDWKTKRLAAQLKATVEQLDSLVMTFEGSSRMIVEHQWPDLLIQQFVVERLGALAIDEAIPIEMVPKVWSRFAENLHGLLKSSNKYPKTAKLNQEHFLKGAVEKLESEIRTLGSRNIPRSISFFQFAFGIFAREGILEALHGFSPVITEELLEIYPETAPFEEICFSIDG